MLEVKFRHNCHYIDTGMSFGKNISTQDAMTDSQVSHAVDYGRIVGRSMASSY